MHVPRANSLTDRLLFILAVVWPLGRMPAAPGTWGSAGAAVLAPFVFLPLSWSWRAVLLAAVMVIGIAASSRAERIVGKRDPGCVVIDEVAGQWLTFAPFAALDWGMIAAGFLLFRFFDIVKPWPVRQAELRFPGGIGVMMDDCLAGIYAALALWVAGLVF